MTSRSELHFIVERVGATDRWERLLQPPKGLGFLHLTDGGPRVDQEPEGAAVAIERQVLASVGGARLVVNGQPAPCITLLRPGDEIEVESDGAWRLHVCEFHDAPVIVQRADDPARRCPLCLEKLVAEQRVFVCACGTRLHIECAEAVAACPDCRMAVELHEGYSNLPEDYREPRHA